MRHLKSGGTLLPDGDSKIRGLWAALRTWRHDRLASRLRLPRVPSRGTSDPMNASTRLLLFFSDRDYLCAGCIAQQYLVITLQNISHKKLIIKTSALKLKRRSDQE